MVPYIVEMVGEPGEEESEKNNKKEKFVFFNLKTGQFSDIKLDDYDILVKEDEIIEINDEDPNAQEFLNNYINEKQL